MPRPLLSNLYSALYIVVVVAEEGQITRAAGRLRMAQPWVSRQIKRVEEALGVLLFRRNRSGVDLTPSGEAFLDGAKEALRQGEIAFHQAQAAHPGRRGKFFIGISPTFDFLTGEEACNYIRQTLPETDIEINSKFVSTQLTLLARMELHLGFVELPISTKELGVLAIRRELLLLAARTGDPLLRKRPSLAGHLEGRQCVVLSRTENPCQHRILDKLIKQGLNPDRVCDVLTIPEIFNHIERRNSFALVPQAVAKLKPPGIHFRELTEFCMDYGVAFYGDHRNPKVRTAVKALAHRFAKQRTAMQEENARRKMRIIPKPA
jgi:DNA-binding transcriptional LysR family regulator